MTFGDFVFKKICNISTVIISSYAVTFYGWILTHRLLLLWRFVISISSGIIAQIITGLPSLVVLYKLDDVEKPY